MSEIKLSDDQIAGSYALWHLLPPHQQLPRPLLASQLGVDEGRLDQFHEDARFLKMFFVYHVLFSQRKAPPDAVHVLRTLREAGQRWWTATAKCRC